MSSFAQVLEDADSLTTDEQLSLSDILHRRAIERRRDEIAGNLDEAESAFRAGKLTAMTPEDIVRAAKQA